MIQFLFRFDNLFEMNKANNFFFNNPIVETIFINFLVSTRDLARTKSSEAISHIWSRLNHWVSLSSPNPKLTVLQKQACFYANKVQKSRLNELCRLSKFRFQVISKLRFNQSMWFASLVDDNRITFKFITDVHT